MRKKLELKEILLAKAKLGSLMFAHNIFPEHWPTHFLRLDADLNSENRNYPYSKETLQSGANP